MSPSKMRKTRAYQDGVFHADGGKDLRAQYTHPDMRAAYNLGYEDQSARRRLQAEIEAHPLRQMRRKVEEAMDRSKQNLPVASIVLDVMEDMLIYLENKESM